MATEKGLFQDEDRLAPGHQQMASWFARNGYTFVRWYLCDMPVELTCNLELAVTSANGFLYGFADVVLDYRTDQGVKHRVLIELKSRFRDFGKVLRQLNTYQTYVPNITKVCFVHDDDWWDETTAGWRNLEELDHTKLDRVDEMRSVFGSQGIYVTPFSLLRKGYFGMYEVPAGRRQAVLSQAYKHREFHGLQPTQLTFNVVLPEERVGYCLSGFRDAPPDELLQIIRLGGNLPPVQEGVAILHGQLQVPCLIDVSHVPDLDGGIVEAIEAMHSRDLSVSLKLDDPSDIRRPKPRRHPVDDGTDENQAVI